MIISLFFLQATISNYKGNLEGLFPAEIVAADSRILRYFTFIANVSFNHKFQQSILSHRH